MDPNALRYVLKLPDGLPGGKGRRGPSALKVFKYPNSYDFLGELAPVEIDTLFAFNSRYLLAGRSIAPFDEEQLGKLGKSEALSSPRGGANAKGASSPKRSPMRASGANRKIQGRGHAHPPAPLTLGVEIQVAEADLKTLIRDLALPNEKILEIVTDVAKGLIVLHENNRAHLDLTPSNCLYADGRALLSDFGACAVVHDPRRLEIRRSPTTRIYAAPEAIGSALTRGVVDDPIDVLSPRCGAFKRMGRVGMPNDMWSLGATIYEIATGVAFYRFLPPAEMERMLAYDDFDSASLPEEPVAWINWFITREAGEYKRLVVRTRDGGKASLVPDRDANVAFFYKVLTGGFNCDGRPPVSLRLWDSEPAFQLATTLAGLLEPDVATRLTSAELANTPLLLKSARFVTAALPVDVSREADTKGARDLIRELLKRLRTEGSDAAQMTTKLFSAFADLATRAFAADKTLAEVPRLELTVALEVLAAYLVAIPFEDPHENFPDIALAWGRGDPAPSAERPASRQEGVVAGQGRDSEDAFAANVARLACRLIGTLGGRLCAPFIYEAAASLAELAYFFPAIYFPAPHAFIEELGPHVKGLGLSEVSFELDDPAADPKTVLLQDFFELVVRPRVSPIEDFYKSTMGATDMGCWFPE